MRQAEESRTIRFGPFEVEPASGELSRNGRKIRLQQQPLQILLSLLSRPGEVVTREELRRQLWADNTFVDFEHGLNAAIKRLRDALSDDSDHPRFVETVPRRGYRMIAPVSGTAEQISTESATTRWWHSVAARVTVGAVAIALLLSAAWIYVLGRTEGILPPPRIVPLTSLPDRAECSSFSPDGNRVAFSRHSDSPWLSGIYIKQIGSDSYLQLTRSTNDHCPVWSPDGRYLAFSHYGYQEHSVYLVSALGGAERKLYSGAPAAPPLDWSPDGKFIAFAAANPEPGSYSILSLSIDTLETHKLTQPPAGYQDWGPAFSPDGRQLAFIRTNGKLTVGEIFLTNANGGSARRLTFDDVSIGSSPVWTRDGKYILFSSRRTGLATIWRISASGGPPTQVAQVGVRATRPAMSPSGTRLAFDQPMINSSLWSLSLADLGKNYARRQVTASKGRNGAAELSPDGSRVAFVSDRSGSDEIYICSPDGSNLLQLTNLGNPGTTGFPRWSPDGQTIVFDSVLRERTVIFAISANGGQPRALTDNAFDNLNPSWSHDGRWIYFTSNRTGQWQIWKVPSEGGEALQITRHGGFTGFESFDRKLFYYAKTAADPDIWKLQLENREESPMSPRIHVSQWTSWALVDKGIFFVREAGDARPVLRYLDLSSGRVKDIAPLDKQPWPLWVSASADGKFVVYQQNDMLVSNVMLLENFQ